MKKLLSCLLVTAAVLAGCKNEDPVTLDPNRPDDQMRLTATPAGAVTLNKDSGTDVAVTFTWAKATDRGAGTSITYRFQLSLLDRAYEYTEAAVQSRSVSFTHAQLNAILTEQLDVTGEDPVEITATVSAEVTASIQMLPEVSATTVTVTPFPAEVTNIYAPMIEGDGDSNTDNDEPNVKFADFDLTQNQILTVGSLDISDWWIDPDFFEKTGDRTLKFLPIDGKYRIIANEGRKYFRVQVMAGDNLAELQNDGSGAIWAYGDVGNPTIANKVEWSPNKAICLAPIGDKKYKLSGVPGGRFAIGGLGFAFGPKFDDWRKIRRPDIPPGDNDYNDPRYAPVNNDFIRVDDGDNVHLNNGWQLQAGHTYTLVLDASNGHQSIQISILEDGVAPTAPPSDFPVTINGTPMTMLNFNGDFKADVDLTQNTPVVIGGVEPADLASWWIDPDFIGIDMSQGYPVPYLVPASGKYRIIANINNRSFRAIPLNVEGNPATLQPDGSGTLWIIGHGIGKPNLNANRSNLGAGWVLEDAMAMAPMGNGIFRTTFKAGTEADANTSGITLFAPPANSNPPLFQIKFFFQPGWGGEFRGSNYNIAENQYPIITTSDVVEIVPDGDVVLRTGKTFETGATYTFNVDITGLQQGGTAVLTVTKD